MIKTQTETVQIQIYVEECCACGCYFGLPYSLYRQASEEGTSFYCPNGHKQCYCEPETVRLKNRIAHLEEQSEHYKQQLRSQKSANTKLKNRINNGICPYCKRSFKNVKRHIECKHKKQSNS